MLLERGAAKVYAVDVGHGQLHASIKADPRVVSLEGLDARRLTRETVPEPVAAIIADVSFISLTKALGPALALAAPGAWLVALVKPQFEAGRSASARAASCAMPTRATARCIRSPRGSPRSPGWRVAGAIPSPVKGGSGNVEFLIGALRDG